MRLTARRAWLFAPPLVLLSFLALSTRLDGRPLLTLPSGMATEPTVDTVQLSDGEALYRANCQGCHGDARTGAGRLAGVPSHDSDGHTWHHSDRNLTEIILDGSGEMGEMMRNMMGTPPDAPRMPAWRGKLSEENIAAILDYIKQGWPPEERQLQRESPMMR